MKIYVVYEKVLSITPGNDASCVKLHKAFKNREEAKQYVEERVNDPQFRWKDSLNCNTFSHIEYDWSTQKRFAIRPEYTYEEGDPEDEDLFYVEIYIRELDLD